MSKDLESEIESLKQAVYILIPYARRYAHMRSTYAPGEVNRAIDIALRCGVRVEKDAAALDGRIYCADGMFGEWDAAGGRFAGKSAEGGGDVPK